MSEAVNSGRSIMRVIHSAGFASYASLAIMCMFAKAKSVNLKSESSIMIDCD